MTKIILTACVTALLAGTTLLGSAEPASASNCFRKVGNKWEACKRPPSSCWNNRCTVPKPVTASGKARAAYIAAYRALHGRH
jgi:hypothetical protein